MPTNGSRKWLKWVIITVIAIVIYSLYCCGKSKAETEPVHTYGPEFNTPDPSQGIYDIFPTDYPDPFFPDWTWQPIPDETPDPDDTMSRPLPANIKYDPFFVSYTLEDGESVEQWMRLNGSNVVLYPPIQTSMLHSVAPSSNTYQTDTDGKAWLASYSYSFNVNGVDMGSTWFRPGGGALTYLIYQDFTTNNTSRQLTYGDEFEFTFTPNIILNSNNADEMYDPIVRIRVYMDYVDNYNQGRVFTQTYMPDYCFLADRTYTVHRKLDFISQFTYLKAIRIELTINPFDVEHYMAEDETTIYWFDSTGNGQFSINYYRNSGWLDSIGGWFGNLFNQITNVFVPDTDMIQTWVEQHATDELDTGNPLNLVKDLYVGLLDKFSGYEASRPVIEVPSLSFNVNGQKVTPFEGYTWNIGSEGVIDGSGQNLWYYVKLCTSILICSGLIGKMWSWFKKWYDTHYAGDGGSE